VNHAVNGGLLAVALGELIMVLVTFGFVIKIELFSIQSSENFKISAGYQKVFFNGIIKCYNCSRNINADKEFYYRNTFHSRSWNLGCYE
jgi:hypothetical protein